MKGFNQRPGTRFSKDGRTVFLQLQVTREAYEIARYWARAHYNEADGSQDPHATAEDQIQGYLNTAMADALENAPPDFDRKPNWSQLQGEAKRPRDIDDDLPF